MSRLQWFRAFCVMGMLGALLLTHQSYSAQPLVSIMPLYKAPSQLAPNSFTAAIYQVTNNTSSLSTFVMQPIPGVTQITNMYGACQNPIQLNAHGTCQLNLRITGSQIHHSLVGGPVICNNLSQPLSCSQPSQSNSFNMTIQSTPLTLNNWIGVLIADDSPPADLATYMNQIISLAPALKQIHFRMSPSTGSTAYQTFVDLINLFRTAYSTPLLIGFHPDNSESSCSGWGCPQQTTNDCKATGGACVLNKSILAMNAINALVDPNQTSQGFNIFSLEQDDVDAIPENAQQFQMVKACLNHSIATGESCPVCNECTPTQAYANPVSTFGTVTSSYGTGYYGPTMLDYAYPQFYNLGKQLVDTSLLNGYFPSYSTSCVNPSESIWVLDVDTGNPWGTYQIPCVQSYQDYPDIFTLLDPTTSKPSPSLVGSYIAYLMSQTTPLNGTVPDTTGASVYITFSGEYNFFGANNWTLPFLSLFYQSLLTDFTTLEAHSLIQNPDQLALLQYAIWSFSAMLPNE